MDNIVDLFGSGSEKEPEPLQCKECGSFRFFLYPENVARCAECETHHGLVRLGPLYLHELE